MIFYKKIILNLEIFDNFKKKWKVNEIDITTFCDTKLDLENNQVKIIDELAKQINFKGNTVKSSVQSSKRSRFVQFW